MSHPNPNAGLIAHWKRVGPILARIRDEELRRFDFEAERDIVDGLLEIGAAHSRPKTTSGLVELQRLFRKARS